MALWLLARTAPTLMSSVHMIVQPGGEVLRETPV
jgi:hypothetical protein